MKGKSIKKNYLYNVSYQILLIVTSLIKSSYVAHILGAENVGRYSYAFSIVSYFVLLATLGITTYGRREISYVQDQREGRTKIFWETKLLQIITSAFSLFLYGTLIFPMKEKTLYLVLSLNIVAVAADVTWFYQGMEEFGKIVLRNGIIKVLSLIYIILAVKDKEDLIAYAFGIAFFLLAGNVSMWVELPKYVDRPYGFKLRPFRDIKTVISLFIPTIAIEVYTVLDKTMIGLITKDNLENGYYEQAVKISRITLSLITALGPVMIPKISYCFQKGDDDKLYTYIYRGYRFVWFLGIPLCFGLIGISYNFVPWFFGDGFHKVSPLLCVLSFLILAIGINSLTNVQYLIPTKRQNLFTCAVIIGAGVNFSLNLFLIPVFQSMGAAVASVIAETVIALVQLYMIRKEVSIKEILICGWRYWVAGIIMLMVLMAEQCYFGPSIFHTVILIGSGAAVYFFILFLLRDDFLFNNIKVFWKKIFFRDQ